MLDIIGGEYLPRNIACLRMDGRLVQVGLIGGSRAEVDLRLVLQNRLTLTGSTLRPRTVAEKGAIADASGAEDLAAARGRRGRPCGSCHVSAS